MFKLVIFFICETSNADGVQEEMHEAVTLYKGEDTIAEALEDLYDLSLYDFRVTDMNDVEWPLDAVAKPFAVYRVRATEKVSRFMRCS